MDVVDVPRWLRPSNLPRLSVCPASGVESEGCVSPSSDATALGHAWHSVMRARMTGDDPVETIDREAEALSVSRDLLVEWNAALTWQAPRRATLHVETDFTPAVAGGYELASCTPDLVMVSDAVIEVIDWKSGDPDYAESAQWRQLEAYAVVAARHLSIRGRARITLHYARLGDDGWVSREIGLDAAEDRLGEILGTSLEQRNRQPSAREYRTGDHCNFCPARARCHAHLANLERAVAVVKAGGIEIAREEIPRFLSALSVLGRIAGQGRDAVKAIVRAEGEEIEDGYRLRISESETLELRRSVVKEHIRKASTRESLRVLRED